MTSKIRSRPTRSKTRKQPHSRQGLPVAQIDSSIPQKLQRTLANPHTASPADILALQQTVGNQAVQQLLARSGQTGLAAQKPQPIQTKLTPESNPPPLIQRLFDRDGLYNGTEFQEGLVLPKKEKKRKPYEEIIETLNKMDNGFSNLYGIREKIEAFRPGDISNVKMVKLINFKRGVSGLNKTLDDLLPIIDKIKNTVEKKKSFGKSQLTQQKRYAKLAALQYQIGTQFKKLEDWTEWIKNELQLVEHREKLNAEQAMDLKGQAIEQAKTGAFGPNAEPELVDPNFGKGATATVARMNYFLQSNNQDFTLEEFQAVFKAEPETVPTEAGDLVRGGGIAKESPNFALRGVAASRINELFGLEVVPRTELAFHEQFGFGQVMGLAKGRQVKSKTRRELKDLSQNKIKEIGEILKQETGGGLPRSWLVERQKEGGLPGEMTTYLEEEVTYEVDWTHPALRRGLANLQLLDALIGSSDRHLDNYFIELDDQGNPKGVLGIDNDLSFGVAETTPEYRSRNTKQTGLPPAIDAQIAERFCSITPEQIQRTVAGLLTDFEIESLIYRFEIIKARLQEKNQDDSYKIPRIDPDSENAKKEWSEVQVQGEKNGLFGSYWTREQDWQQTEAKPKGRLMRPEEAEGFVKQRLEDLIEQTKPKIGARRGKKT